MRILCISDIHNEFERFPPDLLPDADLAVVAGDLTDNGARSPRELLRAAQWLQQMAHRYPLYWVPGNHDFGFEQAPIWNLGTNLLQGPQVWKGATSIYGASLCTAFDKPRLAQIWAHTTANAQTDRMFWELGKRYDIVVSHCPPYDCLDSAANLYNPDTGRFDGIVHIGSPGLRAYIELYLPTLVVCGHVHEAAGEAWIGSRRILNVARHWYVVDYPQFTADEAPPNWPGRTPVGL